MAAARQADAPASALLDRLRPRAGVLALVLSTAIAAAVGCGIEAATLGPIRFPRRR